jgi:hypothetical protein
MESVRIYLENYDQSLLKRFPLGLYGLKTNMTCEELLIMSGTEMSEEVKDQFVRDLKIYDKLGEFLNVIADCCPSEIAAELIHVSQQILRMFLESEHKDDVLVDSSTLVEMA